MPRAKWLSLAPSRAPSCKSRRGGSRASQSFPKHPSLPTKVSLEQSSLVVAAGDMAAEEKLAVSISWDGSPKGEKHEQEKALLPHLLCCLHHLVHSRGQGDRLKVAGARPRGPCAGSRALTLVSGRGAARSASSELRAADSGPSSRCTDCIAAAAAAATASGQPSGALHALGARRPGLR